MTNGMAQVAKDEREIVDKKNQVQHLIQIGFAITDVLTNVLHKLTLWQVRALCRRLGST